MQREPAHLEVLTSEQEQLAGKEERARQRKIDEEKIEIDKFLLRMHLHLP